MFCDCLWHPQLHLVDWLGLAVDFLLHSCQGNNKMNQGDLQMSGMTRVGCFFHY